MATALFLLSAVADTHLATNNLNLRGTNLAWGARALGTARGGGVVNSDATGTVTGATPGVEISIGALAAEWISPPVAADVTISGTISANIWAQENNMSANVAINVIIEIIRANTTTTANSNTLVEIVRSTRTTELGFSGSNTVNNFTTGMTSGAYTAQTLNRGDRFRIRVYGDDAGTMASGFTFTMGYNGTTGGADGDTSVIFTEDFTFESAPAGSQVFLTDVASDVATASVDREAWTSRGDGVNNDVRNTAAGWTTALQVTDTAGGTVVDWFTKKLNPFTLEGMAVANLRALESNAAANASLRCEIARVDSDGTNPTVWGSWCIAPTGSDNGELTTSEVARTANVSGDALAISGQQRLRFRIYIDDASNAAMASAQTVTFFYDGTSAAASGDSYITLPQTISEYTPTLARPLMVEYTQAVSRAANW